MLDGIRNEDRGIWFEPAPRLPVAELLIGQPVEHAATLLPRLFNLCRAAQDTAARLAFGLQIADTAHDTLHKEVMRDHLMKLCVTLPGFFGQSATMPGHWNEGGDALRHSLFGPAGRLPTTPETFKSYLRSGSGLAAILHKIAQCFNAGEAVADVPEVTDASVLARTAQENSVATRHAKHPVLNHISGTLGRGPLWRAAARAYDLETCLDRALPGARNPTRGTAIVTATRGTYAIRAHVSSGIVTAFERVTPTDHLLAPGGILERTLDTLPAVKSGFAPLVMDILDPCSPVRLREVQHA